MNKASFAKEAFARMPNIETITAIGFYRHDVASLLQGQENIGIELGVAMGMFSKRLLDSKKFKMLFGLDAYEDIHDTYEYKKALSMIGLSSSHKLLRLKFDDALDLFPDSYFDFIYIDGFAHTGEEGGKTLSDWYKKLKIGGIMSGDDYHHDWPLVMWAVNHFASQLDCQVTLTEHVQDEQYSQYPTWFIKKDKEIHPSMLSLDERLVDIAKKERKRIHRLRMSPLLKTKRFIFRKVKSAIHLKENAANRHT